MSFSRLCSVSLIGLEAIPVEIEVDITPSDKLGMVIVGLPDLAIRESKERVFSSIKNTGFQVGSTFCTVNLAPSNLRKEGVFYDLPIAIGLLFSLGSVSKGATLFDYLVVGELSLSGELRPVPGVLAIAMLARKMGKRGIILPKINAKEAAMVPGIDVFGMETLKETIEFFKDPSLFSPLKLEGAPTELEKKSCLVDFLDIQGQQYAKRALEVAAAGCHNVILSGSPGCGKTMMAKALLGIMPEMSLEEALEVTKIHSIARQLKEGQSLVQQRPFRSPHHTVSYAGLIGGGSMPKPGEISLAHNGILFLDELPEFSRSVLEALRQPLEDGQVTVSRSQGSFTFPTNILCIAAMNPCPCGYRGHPHKPCKDSDRQVENYLRKISGPLLDRIDMQIDVLPVDSIEMLPNHSRESSAEIRCRVKKAREHQSRRFGYSKTNSQLNSSEIRRHCSLDAISLNLLEKARNSMNLSLRATDRILRVARTIADLADAPKIERAHLLEAINFRTPISF